MCFKTNSMSISTNSIIDQYITVSNGNIKKLNIYKTPFSFKKCYIYSNQSKTEDQSIYDPIHGMAPLYYVSFTLQ